MCVFLYIVAISSVTSGRLAGVEGEIVFLKTKVRYGEISYNDEDVLQRKAGWRPSERQASIVMEDLKPYAVRPVTFFHTGDDPAVKFSYDKLRPLHPQVGLFLGACVMVCGMVFRGIIFLLRPFLEDCIVAIWRFFQDCTASIRRYNAMSRCQIFMFICHFCFWFFCRMFKECMVTSYLGLARCLGCLWGWCTDRFRGR